MHRYKRIDGVRIQFTEEEETARNVEEQAWADARPAREMERIREYRNGLLSATDWTANSDVTMSSDMKTYRQMLRDIPASNTIYEDVDWGTKP